VFRGRLKSSGLTVAVKTCREELGEEIQVKFLQEGHTLQLYDHPNIVKFIGIAALRHPIMIIMEFIPGIYTCPSLCISVCLTICLSVCVYLCISVCVPIRVYVSVSLFLSVCLSVSLSLSLCVCLSVCHSLFD